VDQRWHAPINAAIFYFILAIGINLLFRFNDSVEQTMVFGGAFTSVGVVAVTGLAGVLFAYRAKHIYEASPASKYRMFGLPIVTLAGAITFLAAGAVTLMNLIVPELGFTTTASRLLLLLSVVVAIVWFFLFRAYQRQRGVDIDLAFKQVPPE
jgi:amino acid transporter